MASTRRNSRKPPASGWRSVRMPGHRVAQTLQQRYRLRWHGLLIGSLTLLLMGCASHLQMLWGVETLALRYLVTLSVGYLAYLLVLRAWGARLVARREPAGDGGAGADLNLPDLSWPGGRSASGSSAGSGGGAPWPRTGGGDFGGAGASGDFIGLRDASGRASTGSAEGSLLGDIASGAGEALGNADEGAVVVIPVVAIFLVGAALILGAGSVAMLFFGWDALLAVAVELAFSVATARAAVGVEREGWLPAAVRLTWKPLLGALVCAAVLGATIDHFLPGVQSLPQALRLIQAAL